MSCKRLSFTNGEHSILFDTIYNIVKDETKADSLYSYFNTSEFIDVFGNYKIEEEVDSYKLDDNGEPALFLNESNGKYYFWDKNNEKVDYPYTKTGLLQYFTTNDIKLFGKTVAINFYKDNIEFDFEDLTFVNTNNTNLKTYIEEFADTKSNELMSDISDVSKFMRGVALANSKPFIDEWVKEVRAFYKTLKITSFEDSVELEEESVYDELIRKESFLKDSKNNVNNNVKLFLSLIESNEINDFGEKNFIAFDDIYTTLNKSLKNIVPVHDENGQLEDPYELYLDVIYDLGKLKPYFIELHDYLSSNNISEIFKNQFVSAFNLHKNNFLGSEIIYDEDGNMEYVVKNLSDVSSRKSTILQTWKYNFDKLQFENKLKNTQLGKKYRNLADIFSSRYRDIDHTRFKTYKDNLIKGFKEIGIDITPSILNLYLNDNQYKELELNKRKNNFLKLVDNVSRSFDSKVPFDNQGVYTKLAESKAFFEKEGSDASVFTMGKNKWAYSNPSYLDIKIESWKKNPELLIKHFNSTEYNKGSYYMDYFSRNPEAINNIEIGIFNSVQNQSDSTNAVDNKSIKYTDSLVDYLHKTLTFRKGSGKVYAKSALAGDKSTEYQIHFGNELSVDTEATRSDSGVKLNYKTLDIFYNYFKSEYNRMIYESERLNLGETLLPNYETNAFKSQLFPELSDNSLITLYDENNKPLLVNLDQKKSDILPIIETLLSGKILNVHNNLIKEGLLNEESFYKSKIDKFIINSYDNNAINLSADFLINSMISQVEYSKMLSGDIAYYKNPVDYIKRMSAPYTDGLYQRLNNENEFFNISVIEAVEVDLPTMDNMKKILSPEVYNKYKAINTTDAQAWITPQRWAEIMKGLGKWDNTREAIYNKFFEENPTYTKEELKLMAQPLKGVYFDIVEGRPVFLKYSQAVLVPRLIKGTSLERLYDEMTKGDYKDQIHELITKDGIKVGYPIPEVTHDEQGNVANEFNLNKVKLTNAYWKLQQDLPTKGIKETDIGSQIQKNIFQGLIFNTDKVFKIGDKEFTGEDMIVHLNSLFQNLSDKGTLELINRLGINEESYVIEDEEKLYSAIIKQMESRNDIPDNFIKALQTNISPYGIPGASELFQNVFSSLVNKATVKVQTNGAGFIQMADYGLTKDETKDQGILFAPWFEENSLQPPKKIGETEDGKSIIEPGGIFLSGSMIAKYIPNYRELGDKLWDMIDPEILQNIIGYRIPNQGLASNDALQIMGILPEEMGDTVIPYIGITTKTGSDYDIDKMYLMIPSFKPLYDKEGYRQANDYIKSNDITLDEIEAELLEVGYKVDLLSKKDKYNYFIEDILLYGGSEQSAYYDDFHKQYDLKIPTKLKYITPALDENGVGYPLLNQPKSVLQNKIIEAYKTILTHPDVINDVMNPIDVDYIEKDIKSLIIEEDKSNDVFNGIEHLKLKEHFKLGKAGLGQNINSLVDAVRGGMADLTLNETYLGWGKEENGVTIFDTEYSKDYKDAPKVKLFEAMMGLVNGFVDIAKDPYIVQGNWVTQTNAIGFMLLRAGVHPFYVNAFIGQPILKEYVAFRNNKESKIIDDTDNLVEKFKLEKVRQQLNDKSLANLVSVSSLVRVNKDNYNEKKGFILKEINKANSKNVDTSELINAIDEVFDYSRKSVPSMTLSSLRSQILDSTDLNTQLSIFDQFVEWQQLAKSVTKNVNASKIDVNGKGKNLISLYTSKNTFDNVIADSVKEGNIAGFSTKLFYKDKPTLLQTYKSNSIDFTEKVFNANPKYFLSAKAMPTFNQVSKFIYKSTLENEKLGDKLQKAHYSYIMSGFKPFRMSRDEKNNLLDVLPDKLIEAKKDSNNLFIQELILKDDSKPNSYFISMPNLKKPVSYRNAITDGWRELFEEDQELAEDLVKYAYIISGFNNNINQFHEFIPYEWFNKNRFNSYLKELQVEPIDRNFIDQFFRNNYRDNQIISKAYPSQFSTSDSRTYFVMKDAGEDNYMKFIEIQNQFDGRITKRYFKLQGYTQENQAVYVRTSILGKNDKKGNRFEEYDNTTNPLLSIFPENVIMGNMIDVNLINKVKNDNELSDIIFKENDVVRKFNVITELTVNEVYDKIDNNSYSISMIYKGRDINLVISRDGEIVNPSYYDASTLKDIDIKPSNIKLSPKDINFIFSQIEGDIKSIFPNTKVNTIVYHGSPNYFKEFDKSKLGAYTNAASAKEGIFFGGSKNVSRSYLDKKGQTLNINQYIEVEYGEEIYNKIMNGYNYIASGLAEKVLGYAPKRGEERDEYFIELKDGSRLYDNGEYNGKDKDGLFLQSFIKRSNELKKSFDSNYGGYIDKDRSITEKPFENLFIRPFIINLENPLIVSDNGEKYREESYFERIKKAKEEGYDGLIINDTYDSKYQTKPESVYVVFDTNQIYFLNNKSSNDPFQNPCKD